MVSTRWRLFLAFFNVKPFSFIRSITKTIQVRRTRHAGHCWRSRDELISDVLLWTPTYGRAKAGRPARTYIQQLCEDTGCSPEDLPEAMNNREKWRERVRDIRATSTTWWWWSSSSSRMTLALNNPWRMINHEAKKTKQTKIRRYEGAFPSRSRKCLFGDKLWPTPDGEEAVLPNLEKKVNFSHSPGN